MRSFFLILLLIRTSLTSSLSPPAADCNADNCLRALRRNNDSASPFCSTYIAPSITTITASTTLTIYSIITDPSSSSSSSNSSSLASAATPTYATPCTSASRLSSACSCLFSPTPVPAHTTTVPAATTTIPVCDPTVPNGGITRAQGAFADLINAVTQHPNTTTSDPLQCCTACYRTPGCLTYELSGSGVGTQPGCVLAVAGEGSVRGPRAGATCPLGVYEAYNVEGREVGLGPCVSFSGI